jgi:hypothetical protein
VTVPDPRRPPRPAAPELLVLAKFETFTAWLLQRTARWPRHARFTVTQRLQQHALDTLDDLVVARYRREERTRRLADVNLRLQRMRHLLRLALATGVCAAATFEAMQRGLDETGRMAHGWRTRAEDRP